MPNNSPKILTSALCVPILALSACASVRELFSTGPQEAHSHQEAGSTHIAVLSVAPWDQYRDALQPKFELSPEQALTRVNQANRKTEMLLRSFVGGGINLQGPQSTNNVERVTTTNADGTTQTTTRTEREGPMTAAINISGATQTLPSVPNSNRANLPSDQPTAPSADGALAMNSMLQYTAAAALYQEVQLMNRYVQDAVQATGTQPYVVRLQISVMPTGRRRPYDTYVSLSFDPHRPSTPTTVSTLAPASEVTSFRSYRSDPLIAEQRSPTATFAFNNGAQIEVVPLLVTDDLESTLGAQQEDRIAQFSLGLALLQANVGVNAGFDKKQQALRKIFGRDLNSLVTVGRSAPNTFRVRLGAMGGSTETEAMVPRTYNLTMLLLVPCDSMASTSPRISISGYSEYANTNGKGVLPTKTFEQLWREAHRDKFELADQTKTSLIEKKAPPNGADPEFVRDVTRILGRTNELHSLFELPKPTKPRLAGQATPPNLVLRGTTAEAYWLAGEQLQKTDLIASVRYDRVGGVPPIEMLAQSVAIEDGRLVTARFPSPAALGFSKDDIQSSTVTLLCPSCALAYRGDRCSNESVSGVAPKAAHYKVPLLLEAKPRPEPEQFVLELPTNAIKVASNAATFSALLSYPKDASEIPVYFKLLGADVDSYTCTPACAVTGAHQMLQGRGKLSVSVKNPSSVLELWAGARPDKMQLIGKISASP